MKIKLVIIMDKICPDCGAKQPQINKFCESCGYNFPEMQKASFGVNQIETPQMPEDDKVYMKDPISGAIKICKTGFSWELFLKNFIYLIRIFDTHLLAIYAIVVVAAIFMAGTLAADNIIDALLGREKVTNYGAVPICIMIFLHTCYSAIHNKRVISNLVKSGYEPCTENSKDYLMLNGLMQNEDGIMYPAKDFVSTNMNKILGVCAFVILFVALCNSGKTNFTDYCLMFTAIFSAAMGMFIARKYNKDLEYEYKRQ